MAEDKVITLGPNELPNLVSSYRLDDCNYLQWAQYIRTTLKGHKKLSHIEGNSRPRDDPKFEEWDDEDSLIMTWLWNSMTPEAKWFVSFIDDCTHVTWIFLKKHKYEVCQIFIDFFHLIKNHFNKSIKRLQLDNGIEFVNLEFSKFLKDNDVVHELMKNRHPLEVAKALLFQMFVPNVYWGEVVLTATYLINRLPTRILNGISPIKHMLSFFPSSPLMLSLSSCVFGCVTFIHSHYHRGKLDPRAVKCVFIGYPSNKKGFKLSSSESSMFKFKFKKSRNPLWSQNKSKCMSRIFIVAIDTIKTSTLVQEALKDEN
ncbi:hypothetical protein CR513_36426, partial [Mucuna pruriens]